jgi:hypothetical protein
MQSFETNLFFNLAALEPLHIPYNSPLSFNGGKGVRKIEQGGRVREVGESKGYAGMWPGQGFSVID